MEYDYTYKIVFGLAIKKIPEDFSFIEGKYRKVLDEKILLSNEKGKRVANPKYIEILENETTVDKLVIKLKSCSKLSVPTRGCKMLSNELAKNSLYKTNVLTESGKLFVGIDWSEIEIKDPEEKTLEDSELMKVLTEMMIRRNRTDLDILELVKETIKNNI